MSDNNSSFSSDFSSDFSSEYGGESNSSLKYTLEGHDLQLLNIELQPGQSVIADPGVMVYMDQGIDMSTGVGGGSLLKGVGRWFGGSNFFLSEFKNVGNSKSAQVGLSAGFPGMIMPIDLSKCGGEFYCQKQAYLCSNPEIEVSVAFTRRFKAGFFGGEGFVLQKIVGNKTAFIHAGGTLYSKKLAAGEVIRVDAGSLVGFSSKVTYDAGFVGGVKNILFGGEGLFLAKLTGPGVVLVQSLPFNKLVGNIVMASGLAKQRR